MIKMNVWRHWIMKAVPTKFGQLNLYGDEGTGMSQDAIHCLTTCRSVMRENINQLITDNHC